MGGEVARQEKQGGDVAQFQPQKAKANNEAADAIIQFAKRTRDWPKLEDAIEKKMEDQAEFVRWWDETVTPNRGARTDIVADPRQCSVEQAEKLTDITKQQVSKWRRRLKEPEKYKAMLFGAAYHKAMAETNNTTAAKWTGDPESYTPAKYIEAARAVMGGIDLDPASNAHAQETVQAVEWYDAEENGLLQQWAGRVFLNPPYSYPEIKQFTEKLVTEYGARNVSAGTLLTNNNTDTAWWHLAATHADAVCFTKGRINFYKEDGTETQPTNGQTFFYFGPDTEKFREVFGQFGLVMGVL